MPVGGHPGGVLLVRRTSGPGAQTSGVVPTCGVYARIGVGASRAAERRSRIRVRGKRLRRVRKGRTHPRAAPRAVLSLIMERL